VVDEAVCLPQTSVGRAQAELQQIYAQPNKAVSSGDVWEMLKSLGTKTSKVCLYFVVTAAWNFDAKAERRTCIGPQQEVQEIIWEVDENLDECVDWDEFKLMFQVSLVGHFSNAIRPLQLIRSLAHPSATCKTRQG
jgi:hypothetical protein